MRRLTGLAMLLLFLCFFLPALGQEETEEDAAEWLPAGTEASDAFALGEAYMQSRLYPARLRGVRKLAASQLSGYDRRLYDLLAERCIQVAQGQLASTQFRLSASGLYDKTRFTASELGLDTVYEEQEDAGKTVVRATQEAKDALKAQCQDPSLPAILALLTDYPREMYWYDKSRGIKKSYSFTVDAAGNALNLTAIRFDLSVCSEFSPTRTEGGYTMDTSFGQGIEQVAEKAGDIVAAHAQETDVEKIFSYQEEILSLTGYNYATAGLPYGNPWQIIWVFDGDPDTKVVCEGYAKAFKYLCDRTDFTGDVSAYTVTGRLRSSSDLGAHMWNVVTMDDGENYLVDVTNSRSGQNYLMLSGFMDTVQDGYTVQSRDSVYTYTYNEETLFLLPASELALSGESYLDIHRLTAPVLAMEEEILLGESVTLSFADGGEAGLDTVEMKILSGGETVCEALLEAGETYEFSPGDPGVYDVIWQGNLGHLSSEWSEGAQLDVILLGDLGTPQPVTDLSLYADGMDVPLVFSCGDSEGLLSMAFSLINPEGTEVFDVTSADGTAELPFWPAAGEYILRVTPATAAGYRAMEGTFTVGFAPDGLGMVSRQEGEGLVLEYYLGVCECLTLPGEKNGVPYRALEAGAMRGSGVKRLVIPESYLALGPEALQGLDGLTVLGQEGGRVQAAANQAGCPFLPLDMTGTAPECSLSAARGYARYPVMVSGAQGRVFVCIGGEEDRELQPFGDGFLLQLDTPGIYHMAFYAVGDHGPGPYTAEITFPVEEGGTRLIPEAALQLPEGLQCVEEEAFAGLAGRTFRIPDSVTEIRQGAFAQGSMLLFEGKDAEIGGLEGVEVRCIPGGSIQAWCEEGGVPWYPLT